jgi:hypothetical protein
MAVTRCVATPWERFEPPGRRKVVLTEKYKPFAFGQESKYLIQKFALGETPGLSILHLFGVAALRLATLRCSFRQRGSGGGGLVP